MSEKPLLFAPWRMQYIRSLEKPDGDACFLCLAAEVQAADYASRLVLWQTPHSVVLMNRYPYTNGHLMVAPRVHKAELEDLSAEELTDLQVQTVRGIQLLRKAISPQGFNVGINLGRCAGAGVPGHLHQHIVPRWNGDGSFMSVVGEIRIVPQATEELYRELTKLVGDLDS